MNLNSMGNKRSVSAGNFILSMILVSIIVFSSYLGVLFDSFDKKEIAITIVFILLPLLALFVISSDKTWIPILISMQIVRDLSMGDLMGGGSLKIGDMFILAIFFTWIARSILIDKRVKFIRSNLDLFIILFLVINALSLLWSTDFAFGLVRVLKLVRNYCFYVIVREMFIKDFNGSYLKTTVSLALTGIILFFVYITTIIALGGIADFKALTEKEVLMSQDMGALRSRGTGGGILISGPSEWFIMTGIFLFGIITMLKLKYMKFLTVFLFVLFLLAAMLTLSRTSIITVGIILGILYVGSRKLNLKVNTKILTIIVTTFFVAGAYFGIVEIFSKRLANMFGDRSWSEREELYGAAYDAFASSPVWGIGVGSNYTWQDKNTDQFPSRIVHNLYLTIMSETGMIGMLIFMVLMFYWTKYMWEGMFNTNADPPIKSISLVLFAYTISFFIYSFTVGEFESFEPWLAMATVSAIRELCKAKEVERNLINNNC